MRRYKLLCVKQTIRIYMHAKSLQLCLTLCDPMDSSPPGSSVHGIFQARTLEWVAISSSRGCSQSRDRTCISCVSCTAGRFLTVCTTRKALYTGLNNRIVFLTVQRLGGLRSECVHTWVLMSVTVFHLFALNLGEGNGTPLQYSCLEIKWTEEPGRLQSMGSQRVGHD